VGQWDQRAARVRLAQLIIYLPYVRISSESFSSVYLLRCSCTNSATVQARASEKTTGVLATIIGLGVLLLGASTVFAELKDALNTIWGVAVKPGRAFFTLVRDRFLSFSIVLAIGFLLLISLVLSAVLAALGKYMSARLPLPAAVWQACDFLVSFAVISALFAMISKYCQTCASDGTTCGSAQWARRCFSLSASSLSVSISAPAVSLRASARRAR
jgi:Virulence factor BrkB